MSANYSNATHRYVYQPTIIEDKLLLSRLTIQIAFVKDEFKRDPRGFAKRLARELLTNPRIILAVVVGTVVLAVVMRSTTGKSRGTAGIEAEPGPEVFVYDINRLGHAGFGDGTGEGSGPTPRRAQGGGGGGNHDPKPSQAGELPPPSPLLAPIPISAPIAAPALPMAGIKIDPALWKDLQDRVYGDPTSSSTTQSQGPGDGGGIGSGKGLGIGPGDGAGVGPGWKENTGGGYGMNGCCGEGGGMGQGGGGYGEGFSSREVDQRARVLSKPEPQYTEEARRNQVTGTVVLRVVFSRDGEVVQIRALNTLPFGLTERAIAAARQIKFEPALKGGHPVSVFMQLEYNFNLY
jgi:TonB family protein